jgi:hypothetical protein
MPARKGSIEKNFGRKVLDGAKYIGKNSWKVLPVGSEINFKRNGTERMRRESSEIKYVLKELTKSVLHRAYSIVGLGGLAIYITASVGTNSLNPINQFEKYSKEIKNLQVEYNKIHQHNQQVNSSYDSLFKDAKNFADSFAIYNHYCLPIKLGQPTLDEKETAVKMNRLEKEMK